jgi:quercetin dioxygenase-like cupin family protein
MEFRIHARTAAALVLACGVAAGARVETARADGEPGHAESVLVPGADRGVRAYRLLDLEWKPGPLPGSRVALLAGDPKTGLHHGYLELAAGSAIAPHWHSTDELVTIVSGTLLFGVGEKADRGATRLYGPGAFVFVPARVPHYAFAKDEVVLSQTRTGAVDFNWLNPEDDPARKAGAAEAGKK